MNQMFGKLFLIPAPLSENSFIPLPAEHIAKIKNIRFFIVERAKTARAYLKQLQLNHDLQSLELVELDKHGSENPYSLWLAKAKEGQDIGLLSEAGCPAIADPGSELVAAAHQQNIQVVPLIGPSSIFLALMASGLQGQNFCFNGYLPIPTEERKKKIAFCEQIAKKNKQTQIFIETPYRNIRFLKDLLQFLQAETVLCLAVDITGENEYIVSRKVKDWQKKPLPEIDKKPCIFLFL